MLFFDLDGTLVDSSGIWLQIDLDFTARRGLAHTQEYHDFVIHSTAPVAAQFTKDYYHLPESADEIIAEWSAQAAGGIYIPHRSQAPCARVLGTVPPAG